MNSPSYSFVVPIFRDAPLAEAFCTEFEQVFQDYLGVTEISEVVLEDLLELCAERLRQRRVAKDGYDE